MLFLSCGEQARGLRRKKRREVNQVFGRIGKMYKGTPKVKENRKGSIKNLLMLLWRNKKKKKGVK
jgi:hypothetical protein